MNELRLAVMRQLAAHDIGNDYLLALGQKFRGKMAADESVAAENHMSHRVNSLV